MTVARRTSSQMQCSFQILSRESKNEERKKNNKRCPDYDGELLSRGKRSAPDDAVLHVAPRALDYHLNE
jgi:hypothetical protein